MSEENALAKFDKLLTEKAGQAGNYVSELTQDIYTCIKRVERELSGYYAADKAYTLVELAHDLREKLLKLEVGQQFLTVIKELEEQFPANLIEEQTRFEGVVFKLEQIQETINRVNTSPQVEGSGDVDSNNRYWRIWDTFTSTASYVNDSEAQHIMKYGDVRRYQFTKVTKEAYDSFWYKYDKDIEALVAETETEELYSTLRSQIEDFKEKKSQTLMEQSKFKLGDLMTFEEWLEENEEELDCLFAETGQDREIGFDRELALEKLYEKAKQETIREK